MEQLMDPKILALGLMMATPAKIFVDYVKANIDDMPEYAPPAFAFLASLAFLLVINLSNGQPFTTDMLADTTLAAGYAAFTAVFTTVYHNETRAAKSETKVEKRATKKEEKQ